MNNIRLESNKPPGGSEASDRMRLTEWRQPALADHADQQGTSASRICSNCELQMRIQEWSQMPAAFQEANPDYATAQCVKRDLKIANKGRLWVAQAQHISLAKTEIQQGRGLEENLKGIRKKKAIMQRATLLAQALLNALKSGNLIAAFSAAGQRMKKDDAVGQQYIQAFDEAMDDKDDERKQIRLDNLEEELAQTMDYETCIEYGEKQSAMLKALDFIDAYGEGLRLYNVCRAKTGWNKAQGKHCSCGLAFPAKMWARKFKDDPNRWKFKCEVNWAALIEAQMNFPADKLLKSWVNDMHNEYGDVTKWPKVGCGADFIPWAKGMSMVAEVKCPDGVWQAFSADRLPAQLDDEIKKAQAAFYLAGRKLNEEELLGIIPVSFPMTNHLKGFKSIAKYPVDEWEKQNLPCFTTKSWCKLAMLIASKDMTNLEQCFAVAKKISDKLPEQEP